MRPLAVVPLALLPALLLAACDRGVSLHDASAQEVAKAVNRVARQEPGRWQTSTELVAMDLGPGAGAAARRAVAAQIGRRQVAVGCLSPEQAGAPGFGDLRGGTCLFDRFVLEHGKLDAAMHCTRADGRITVVQSGRYESTGYDMRSTLRQQGGAGTLTTTMRITGRREGACGA